MQHVSTLRPELVYFVFMLRDVTREADQSHPFSVEVKNGGVIPPFPYTSLPRGA
jgi:hypothetical protein